MKEGSGSNHIWIEHDSLCEVIPESKRESNLLNEEDELNQYSVHNGNNSDRTKNQADFNTIQADSIKRKKAGGVSSLR